MRIIIGVGLIGLLLTGSSLFAQNKRKTVRQVETKKHQLQIGFYPSIDSLSKVNANEVFIAYRGLAKNGMFNTVELQNAFYRKEAIASFDVSQIRSGLRFQSDFLILKQYSYLMPFIGGYAIGGFEQRKLSALSSSVFSSSTTKFSLRVGLIPSLHILPVEWLEIGIGLPIEIVELAYQENLLGDPSIPVINQSTVTSGVDLGFRVNQLRLLIGVNL